MSPPLAARGFYAKEGKDDVTVNGTCEACQVGATSCHDDDQDGEVEGWAMPWAKDGQ